MSTDRLAKTNQLLSENQPLVDFALQPDLPELLRSVTVDWNTGDVIGMPEKAKAFLRGRGWLSGANHLNEKGLTFLSKFLVEIEALATKSELVAGKFRVDKVLASGKNSVAFKAFHEMVGRYFVLKFFRPGRGRHVITNLQKVGAVGGEPFLVHPVDFLEWPVLDANGQTVSLGCLVFPFCDGATLDDFLRSKKPISPYFVQSYLEQVGAALAALEAKGLYHGDLHSNNILVLEDADKSVHFRVIDVSYGADEPSAYEYQYTDFEYFKEHLAKTLWNLQRNLHRISLQKHLGARLFTLARHILQQPSLSFGKILSLLQKNEAYEDYKRKQEEFLREKFKRPTVLGLLRYEEIINPTVAVDLFVPYPEFFDEVSQFGSAVVFGHRGSGKSTYLASMAFFPGIKKPIFDFRQKFGVFFACRQGEFKQYSSKLIFYTPVTFLSVKHILVLKIIRRVIDLLNRAAEVGELPKPADYSAITRFLEPFVAEGAVLSFPSANVSALENLHASLLQNEIRELDVLLSGQANSPNKRFLGETQLIEFIGCVRTVFPELGNTQFYFLFDDAGEPNLPTEVQMVLNEILRCGNPDFCVKISTERFAYHFKAADDKVLENTHDYKSFNISDSLSLGSGRSPERRDIKEYFTKLVAKRLKDSSFKSENIADYLGEELVSVDKLVEQLASRNKRSAYFCGWNVVWQLADRTTRHLLELISTIFAAGHVDEKAQPAVIRPYVQHKAIKDFSEGKLKSLNFIPGSVTVGGVRRGLGKQLYEFAAAFGKVAYTNLKRGPMVEHKNRTRFYEKLAIEIDGEMALDPEAEEILHQLIRFAVVDDSKLVKSFDDQTKKPIFVLNRIFCPALGISFRRESHWRLSSKKFGELLRHPNREVRDERRVLKQSAGPESTQADLL